MINLLSTEKKAEIRAARTNTILVRYILVLTLALGFIAGAFLVSKQSLETSQASAVAQLGSEGASPEEIALVTSEAASKERSTFRVSVFLERLAAALPANTVANTISIKQENINGTPINLSLYTTSETQPEQLSQALEMSGLFTNTALQSTTRNNKDVAGHPVKVTFSLTLNTIQPRTSL